MIDNPKILLVAPRREAPRVITEQELESLPGLLLHTLPSLECREIPARALREQLAELESSAVALESDLSCQAAVAPAAFGQAYAEWRRVAASIAALRQSTAPLFGGA